MAIDIRANVTCSLGTIIGGNIGDDYIQGSGLIKTSGSVQIDGLITPNIGTIVTFSYTKSGITRTVPRKLRVLSSFADPFRRTTQVELGCKLTYLSDLKDQLSWDAFDDPANSEFAEEDATIITLPISAISVASKCLTELGISGSVPLTNKFSIAEFDFSAGYVSVLNDLLVSESYCGYLDIDEQLQVFSLNQGVGSGPVFTASDIIDLGPIGVGDLPGEAVTVNYSTLKLKPPEQTDGQTPEEQAEQDERLNRINWEKSEVVGSPQGYIVNYVVAQGPNEGVKGVRTFSGSENTTTETNYKVIRYFDAGTSGSSSVLSFGQYREKEVPEKRTVTVYGSAITKGASIAEDYASIGADFNNAFIILSYTEEYFFYDDYGNEIAKTVSKYEPIPFLLSGVQFDFVYPASEADPTLVTYVTTFELIQVESSSSTSEVTGDYTRETNTTYIHWSKSLSGQQAIASYKEALKAAGTDITIGEALSLAEGIITSGLVHKETIETTNTSGASKAQERPSQTDRLNANYADGGDPNNGWRTESQSELELAVGSATAQRRIELSMPYAPDDYFYKSGLIYFSQPSDAPTKANLYGRVQNNLLLGNRNGISLQLSPEKLPHEPFSPIYVEANGLTAQYRSNGANWAFDSNGVICSIDALFWGAVGGTGNFWFPVAPGVVSLPESPTVVDTTPTQVVGTVSTVGSTPQTTLNTAFPTANVGDGVQDQSTDNFWVYDGGLWSNVGATPGPEVSPATIVLPYNETVIYDGRIRLINVVSKFNYSLELLTIIPPIRVRTTAVLGVVILTPAAVLTLDAPFSSETGGLTIPVDSSNTTILGLTLDFTGDPNVIYVDNTVDIAIAGQTVGTPATEQIIFNFEGLTGSTDIRSSSDNSIVATVYGTAALSNTNRIFGTGSLYLDGPAKDPTGDWITYNLPQAFGLDDFCVELWIFTPVESQGVIYATPWAISDFCSLDIDYDTGGGYIFYLYDNILGADVSIIASITYGQWQHIALYRNNGTFYIAVDGVVTLSPVTLEMNIIETLNIIGEWTTNDGTYAVPTTWIDEHRVTFGNSVYPTSNFTPPSSPFLNPWNPGDYFVFNFDGSNGSTSISSSSGSFPALTPAVYGSTALTTSSQKFGTASLSSGGPGNYISYDMPATFGQDDFCIEFWIYTSSTIAPGSTTYGTIFSHAETGAFITIDLDYTLNRYFLYLGPNINDFTGTQIYEEAGVVGYNQWQHIAVYRLNDIFYFAVNGTVSFNISAPGLNYRDTSNFIASYYGYYDALVSLFDELRITFGSSVYGATNFTPPSAPF